MAVGTRRLTAKGYDDDDDDDDEEEEEEFLSCPASRLVTLATETLN
jgi:hypothetical protein